MTLITPIWAIPLAPPPLRARPSRGLVSGAPCDHNCTGINNDNESNINDGRLLTEAILFTISAFILIKIEERYVKTDKLVT